MTVTVEISNNEDEAQGGYVYVVVVDRDEPVVLGSGHAATVKEALRLTNGLVERNMQ